MDNLTPERITTLLTDLLTRWTPLVITLVSLLRVAMVKAEGALMIWIEPTPQSHFWAFWSKLMRTVEYLSLSHQRKPGAVLALNEVKQERAALKQQDQL